MPPLREVIARHGIAAKKSLGQNFILDLNVTRRIARAAAPLDRTSVIEIGPGPGGLTRALLEEGADHVVAIERDRRCLAALGELAMAYPGKLELVEGDALKLDPAALTAAPRKIVANLPYNIATALLLRWFDRIGEYQGLVLMFQREVAERLVARPRSPAYGRLSVITQWLTEPKILFDLPPRAFVPPPKVTSSVVSLRPRPAPLMAADKATLERVTAAAFGQRRKMLRSSLKSLGVPVEPLLATAGIASTARAEELSVAEFCALARALQDQSPVARLSLRGLSSRWREVPHEVLVRLVRSFLRHVMAAGKGATPGVGRVMPLPYREHIAVDALGVAARAPDHQQRHGDLVARLEIGLVHLEIAGRAGAVVGARALDRFPIEAADVFGERLGIEEAEPDTGL